MRIMEHGMSRYWSMKDKGIIKCYIKKVVGTILTHLSPNYLHIMMIYKKWMEMAFYDCDWSLENGTKKNLRLKKVKYMIKCLN